MGEVLLLPMFSISKRLARKCSGLWETSRFVVQTIVDVLPDSEILPELPFFTLVDPALVQNFNKLRFLERCTLVGLLTSCRTRRSVVSFERRGWRSRPWLWRFLSFKILAKNVLRQYLPKLIGCTLRLKTVAADIRCPRMQLLFLGNPPVLAHLLPRFGFECTLRIETQIWDNTVAEAHVGKAVDWFLIVGDAGFKLNLRTKSLPTNWILSCAYFRTAALLYVDLVWIINIHV